VINVSIEDGVAIVTVSELESLSRHDLSSGLALRDAVRDAADSDDVKVVLLRAAGADFCRAVSSEELDSAAQARAERIWTTWNRVFTASSGLYQNVCFCKKVVIAVVRGECSGAGSLLVLCSDLALASPDATFHSPFGSIPEANFVLAALTMRLNRAKAWMLTEGRLTAEEAFSMSLINRVVPSE